MLVVHALTCLVSVRVCAHDCGFPRSYFIIPLLCDAMDHATRICRMNKVMRFIKASPEAVLIREFNKLLFVIAATHTQHICVFHVPLRC